MSFLNGERPSVHEFFPSAILPCEPDSVRLQRTDAAVVFWSGRYSASDVSQILALLGPALRKTPCSRKVDKCGTVFGEATLYAMVVWERGMRSVISSVKGVCPWLEQEVGRGM